MSPSQQVHNLTDADRQQLQNGLEAAKRALAQIDLAERAGYDVAARKAQINAVKDKIEKTLNVYFPSM